MAADVSSLDEIMRTMMDSLSGLGDELSVSTVSNTSLPISSTETSPSLKPKPKPRAAPRKPHEVSTTGSESDSSLAKPTPKPRARKTHASGTQSSASVSSDASCTSSQESLNQAPPLPPDYISALSCPLPNAPSFPPPNFPPPTRSASETRTESTCPPSLPEKKKIGNKSSCPPALPATPRPLVDPSIIRHPNLTGELLSPAETAADRTTLTPENVDQNAVYGNFDAETRHAGDTANLEGFPLPRQLSKPEDLTPLSEEALNVLDPTFYMPLWHAQSENSNSGPTSLEIREEAGSPVLIGDPLITDLEPTNQETSWSSAANQMTVKPSVPNQITVQPAATNQMTIQPSVTNQMTVQSSTANYDPMYESVDVPTIQSAPPPIPHRLGDDFFSFPTDPNGEFSSQMNDPLRPKVSVQRSFPTAADAYEISDKEFRTSYMILLPDDPFDGEDLFGDQCFSLPVCSVSKSSSNVNSRVPPLNLSPEKLVPKRAAPPPPPEKSAKQVTDPPAPLYAEINKPRVAVRSDSESPTYYLAGEAESQLNLHQNWFDNQALSESDDTLDDDSCSEGEDSFHPELPVKLPTSPSPKSNSKTTVRKGYLYKQGGISLHLGADGTTVIRKQNNKGWRKRYVTFDGEKLKYFTKETSTISKRIIPVEAMKTVESDIKTADSGKYKFRVVTYNRSYLFAADSIDDNHFWSQIIMSAILNFSKENGGLRGSMGKGMMRGGDMHTPDKEGSVKLNEAKKYLVVKGGRLCYYNTEGDYQFACPIHEVLLHTASVKEAVKQKLVLITPYCQYTLSFDADCELEGWRIALEDGIAAALSDDKVLEEIYQNPSNRLCADCSGPKPHWAVLHLSIIVCSQCAGVHRKFWPSKVKSLRMDTKVWTPSLVQLYISCGNQSINEVWEFSLKSPTDKITSTSNNSQRRLFILKKYMKKSFYMKLSPHTSTLSKLQLNKSLHESIRKGSMRDVIYYINLGGDATSLDAEHHSAIEMAERSSCPSIAEYLKHNGVEGETFHVIWAVINVEATIDEKKAIKSGALYRMHNIKKGMEFPKQWVVLCKDRMAVYDNECDPEPKTTIPCSSIINVALHQDERNEPSFELLCKQGGQLHVYGSGQWEMIREWRATIIRTITNGISKVDLPLDDRKSGFVHCKRGSLGLWKWCWVWTKKKSLCIFDSDGSWEEEIDLRKVLKLSLVSGDDTTNNNSPAEEPGPSLVLYLSNHYIYIQSDIKSETECWHREIDSGCKEKSHHLEDQQLNKENIPVLVAKCVEFIFLNGMTSEGIYRLSGVHSKVSALLSDLTNDARSVHIKLEEYSIHDVANVLKRYLRNLQEPVMARQLYGQWISTSKSTQHDRKLYAYKSLLDQLPLVNYATLKLLIGHLSSVSENELENKMSKMNLATVFGPVLLSSSPSDSAPSQNNFSNTSYEIKLVIDLIDYYTWLFSVDESEINRNKVIQKKMEELRSITSQQTANPNAMGEFILGIYITNKLSEPINKKVTLDMTASEIVSDAAHSKKIPRFDGYSLFEVVCSDDLERPLRDDEKVLSATLATSGWNAEHSKDYYLCIKENYVAHNIEHLPGPDISRYTELLYTEKKNWKRMYFELNSSHLICYKDRSESKVAEWPVHHLIVYIGVERKRKPPTNCGITFLVHGEDNSKSRDFLGRSICFHSEQELYTWLSSINYIQVQDGSLPTTSRPLQHSSQAMSRSTSALPIKSPKIKLSWPSKASIRKIIKHD